MGSQMTKTRPRTKRDPDKNPKENEDVNMKIISSTLNLLSLPNEVLVKIMSFLPETRDRLKLRYVSRKLRSISETPSLWRNFVWPDCNPREGTCLENVMKSFGMHIRRLSFHHSVNQPSVLTTVRLQAALKSVEVSSMVKLLQYCSNLTHLSLPTFYNVNSNGSNLNFCPTKCCDTGKQLRDAIQELKNLEMLSIHCPYPDSIEPYLNLKTTLQELTIHTVIGCTDIEVFQNWMVNGFTPSSLNIVVDKGSMSTALVEFRKFLLSAWLVWNSQIPAGRTACLRLYSSHKAPLNLFQKMPVFQIRYGEAAVLPFVRWCSTAEVPIWLAFTDIHCGGKVMYKAKYIYQDIDTYDIILNFEQGNQLQMDNNFTKLTELDLSNCCFIGVKQAVLACPSLQRLNLKNNTIELDDLQMIAACCSNLRGLNLAYAVLATPDIQKVWEILSGMKLTHLSMHASFFGQIIMDDIQLKQLTSFFKLCTQMRALELYSANCRKHANDIHKLLSYFPSLEYCRLTCHEQSTCVQDIIATCEKLKYFYFNCPTRLSLSSAYNNNLQQLYISSTDTDVNDNFMDTVSAHGGLIHVAFSVLSMTGKGITTLIKNSPNLLTFIGLHKEKGDKEKYLELLNTSLGKKFAHRKLFTSGLSLIVHLEKYHLVPDDWVEHTDLLSLWP